MGNLSCTQWNCYTLSYMEINYYCHYCYLYHLYKSLLKFSDWNPCHPIQRLQRRLIEPRVKLVSCWIFSGYSFESSHNFTEVHPVSAAGGRLAHLTEPHAELLETDLETVIIILTQNNCSVFNIFHVMWPSDSNPVANCISKQDKWDTAVLVVFIRSQ